MAGGNEFLRLSQLLVVTDAYRHPAVFAYVLGPVDVRHLHEHDITDRIQRDDA